MLYFCGGVRTKCFIRVIFYFTLLHIYRKPNDRSCMDFGKHVEAQFDTKWKSWTHFVVSQVQRLESGLVTNVIFFLLLLLLIFCYWIGAYRIAESSCKPPGKHFKKISFDFALMSIRVPDHLHSCELKYHRLAAMKVRNIRWTSFQPLFLSDSQI